MKVLKHTLFVQFPQKKEWLVGRSNGGKAIVQQLLSTPLIKLCFLLSCCIIVPQSQGPCLISTLTAVRPEWRDQLPKLWFWFRLSRNLSYEWDALKCWKLHTVYYIKKRPFVSLLKQQCFNGRLNILCKLTVDIIGQLYRYVDICVLNLLDESGCKR